MRTKGAGAYLVNRGGRMAGASMVSGIAEAASRVLPRVGHDVQGMLDLSLAQTDTPALVIVGIGSAPPKTTQSLITAAAARGMSPGQDVIATNYRSLRVGAQRGFVRLADGAGDDGRVLAGKGHRALFLFRGGGNLSDAHMRTIGAIQAVDGATSLSDLSFIQRAGSKATTHALLQDAGLSLAETIPARGVDEAVAAFDRIRSRFGADTVVLKKVNSLGGKDVHFVRSTDDVRAAIASDPTADYVVQEFLPYAKDQDVRVHMVHDSDLGDFRVADAYVRNRAVGGLTPNLANNGFATPYSLSPWEEQQALESARVLARGSATPPLHVGLDLFPRRPITASVVEANAAGTTARDTAVIGEAASSAGTKGTEIVREGRNPVVEQMLDEIERRMRAGG